MLQHEDFATLMDRFVDEWFDASPTTASSLGLASYEHRLDERSLQALEKARERNDRWLRTFEALDGSPLPPDDRHDLALVLGELRARQALRGRDAFRSNPVPYVNLGLSAVAGMFERRLLPDADLVDAARARMAAIPTVLDAARELLDASLTPEIHVRRATRLCEAAVRYFDEIVALSVTDESQRQKLAAAGAAVAHSYREFAEFVGRLEVQPSTTWMLGAEHATTLLGLRHGVGLTALELLELGEEAVAEESGALQAARDMAGHAARAEVESAEPFSSMAERVAYLQSRVDAARSFVSDKGLLQIPGREECVVRQTPAYLAPILRSFAYSGPPPLAHRTTGWLNTPLPGSGFGRPLGHDSTVVHESYPGHHLHAMREREVASSRPIRQLIRTPFFSEGWGLYAERLMYDAGYFDHPVELIAHHQLRLVRAGRVVVDLGLHTGRMAESEAVDYLTDRLGLGSSLARTEVERYMASPLQATSYYVGYRQLLDIRAVVAERGMAIEEFHDRATLLGAPPLHLARAALTATTSH